MQKADENNENSGRKFEISGAQDLPDNPRDEEKMQPEETIIDLPDVNDIPGQEHVRPPSLGILADTTIASDDEEGVGIFDEEDDTLGDNDLINDNANNVTREEKKDLQQAGEDVPTNDSASLKRAAMDNVDEDGEPLNEKGFGEEVSGRDIDVPGADDDDANEDIGEEDEENNPYSLGDNDENNESNYTV